MCEKTRTCGSSKNMIAAYEHGVMREKKRNCKLRTLDPVAGHIRLVKTETGLYMGNFRLVMF
jgi:hypothetical protein